MGSFATISQSFSVKYEYKLYFTEHLFSTKNKMLFDVLKKYSSENRVKVLFVVDGGVYLKHPDLLDAIEKYCSLNDDLIDLGDVLVLAGGEESKNDESNVKRIHEAINEKGICRHSFVIVIGGGAIIDMTGYAAATAHRGVKLIRIPTTVLSQNDAAVGVKNGINAFGKKNYLGTFSLPEAIINDFNFLRTLDQRDWISGIAEAIKVALLKDPEFFDFICANSKGLAKRKMDPMQYLIHRCAEIHMKHIAEGGDPFEKGSSRPLDFGHWAAHKLEQMTAYRLRHGEAVAMGIALDVTYANLMGLVEDNVLEKTLNLFKAIGFDLHLPIEKESDIDSLLQGIGEFREHLGGKLTITLISAIGVKHDVHKIDVEKMRKAISLRSIPKEELSC